MKQFLFKGHKVRYFESGEGEPLIFLHNGGNDHRIWDHQLAHFSKTHHVIATDHIGFGESDKPDIEYTLPLFTGMLASLVSGLELAPVTLIGHCIGAAMAINYAGQNPERIKKLVAFNVATERTLLAGPLAQIYLNFSQSREQREQFCGMIESQPLPHEETDKGLLSQYGDVPPDDPEFADYIYELYNLPGQMRSLYNNLSNFASFAALDQFVKPAGFPPFLLIWGQSNQILPVSAGEVLSRRLQPDQVKFIKNCGHLAMRERPREVNRLIEEFLENPSALSQSDR